jgi:hypothetical protein
MGKLKKRWRKEREVSKKPLRGEKLACSVYYSTNS